ncbi:hypothetical protein AJ79_04129 [Helicocarpus griseus UAMH5409]|uniref:Uncharacterized protein n=1 Tax=Helicocarpus griseus UAMH5409 TaxID=1447875 RepID=A0A2B7XV28_9EURO|nr:hypothetical protein AJ79_04129 [Helicocarpus griseus UAMH5409]
MKQARRWLAAWYFLSFAEQKLGERGLSGCHCDCEGGEFDGGIAQDASFEEQADKWLVAENECGEGYWDGVYGLRVRAPAVLVQQFAGGMNVPGLGGMEEDGGVVHAYALEDAGVQTVRAGGVYD